MCPVKYRMPSNPFGYRIFCVLHDILLDVDVLTLETDHHIFELWPNQYKVFSKPSLTLLREEDMSSFYDVADRHYVADPSYQNFANGMDQIAYKIPSNILGFDYILFCEYNLFIHHPILNKYALIDLDNLMVR